MSYVCVGQVCMSYVCVGQVCMSYVCVGQVCMSYVCVGQVCMSYVSVGVSCSAELTTVSLILMVRPLCVCVCLDDAAVPKGTSLEGVSFIVD